MNHLEYHDIRPVERTHPIATDHLRASSEREPALDLIEPAAPIERDAVVAADDGPAVGTGLPATMLASIRHHRRWAIAALLAVLLATTIAYALIPRRFTARADLWLDHGFERLDTAVPATAAASNSPLARNTEVRLLGSTDLAAAVVDRLGLANVRGVGQPADGPLLPRATARRQAIDAVRDDLSIETNGASYAVAVRYTAADPVIATGILNHLVDSYVADRRSGGARGRERAAMQAQVAAAREETIRDEAAMGGYRDALGLIRREQDRAQVAGEVASLDAAVKLARIEQATAEGRLREAQGGGAGEGVTSPRLRELNARQAQFSRSDSAGFADLRRDIAAETQRVMRLADAARAARTRTELLATARTRASDELKAADDAAAQLKQIGEKAAVARARYADFAGRYQALVAAQRRDPGTAYVISRGSIPSARSFPDPLVFALGGLIAALVVAGALVVLLEALTRGFRTRHHLERVLGLPVIGMVPDLARMRGADIRANETVWPPDYLLNHRHSAYGAAFRAIHTGLRLGITSKSRRSIAICSALPEEGKTTVAVSLARSAALAGLRVVLVDCDARRPAASRALGPHVKTGLAHVLEDGVDFREALQQDTPSGAWFIAQGASRLVGNGAVASPAMAALIAQLERSYDLVVLDTAPALALSEARALAAMANGVLLVARARQTPVEATRMARELLETAGANVVAATLTMVDP